jgi:uncharacterized glyoxalase superfamily protein PhnB
MVVNQSAAPGAVVPVLVYARVGEAIDWLCDAFGFAERLRYGPDGNPTGAQLSVGDGAVFLASPRVGQSPKWANKAEFLPPRPNEVTHSVAVHVDDVDRHYERARQFGADPVSARDASVWRAPIHGRGSLRPQVDIHPVGGRCCARGLGWQARRAAVKVAKQISGRM